MSAAGGAAPDIAAAGASAAARPLWVLSLPGRRFPQNPYTRLFCDAFTGTQVRIVDLRSWRALLLRLDVIHVHWPEHYVSAQTLPRACVWVSVYAAYFLLAKLLGIRIVWTVHNVLPTPNRHPWLLGPWMRLFRRLVDGHVFLSRSSRLAFAARFPTGAGKPGCEVAHGSYAVSPPDAVRRAAWRARVAPDRDALLVGFLGTIKAYKNVAALRALPAALDDGRRVQAVVAGLPDAASRTSLAAVTRDLGDRVCHIDAHLADRDLNDLIQAMDVVFLPYLQGWNSGLAMLVLANRTKLLASDLPMFRTLREEVGEPWMATYAHPAEIAATLATMARQPIGADAERRLDHFLEANSFEAGAARLARFYTTVCAA